MMGHQAVEVQAYIEPLQTLSEFEQTKLAIVICPQDSLLRVTPNGNMMDCIFIFDT